jgi:hypothetical protein
MILSHPLAYSLTASIYVMLERFRNKNDTQFHQKGVMEGPDRCKKTACVVGLDNLPRFL